MNHGWRWNPARRPHQERLSHAVPLAQRESGLQLITWLLAPTHGEGTVHAIAIMTGTRAAPRVLRGTFTLGDLLLATDPLEVQLERKGVWLVHGPGRAAGALTGQLPEGLLSLGWNLAFEPDGPPTAWDVRRRSAALSGAEPATRLTAQGTVVLGQETIPVRGVRGAMLHTWGASLPAAWNHLTAPSFRENDYALQVHGVQDQPGSDWALRGILWDGQRAVHLEGSQAAREGAPYAWAFRLKGGGVTLDGEAVLPAQGVAALPIDDPKTGSQRWIHASGVASVHVRVESRRGFVGRDTSAMSVVHGAALELGRSSRLQLGREVPRAPAG